jgi:hypothetical protein
MPPIRLTILALAVLLSLATPRAVRAGALAPAKTSDVVTLLSTPTKCGIGSVAVDARNLPDGTTVNDFVIPAKSALVITEVEVLVGDATASQLTTVGVTIDGASQLALVSAIADAAGNAAATVVLPSGSVVGAGHKVCIGASSGIAVGAVHGFLAKAK